MKVSRLAGSQIMGARKCVEAGLAVPAAINPVWSMSLIRDKLVDGSSVRLFNVMDDFNGEALGIEVDFTRRSERFNRTVCNE